MNWICFRLDNNLFTFVRPWKFQYTVIVFLMTEDSSQLTVYTFHYSPHIYILVNELAHYTL